MRYGHVGCVLIFALSVVACGEGLSRTASENEFFKCELNVHAESDVLGAPSSVPYDFRCEAKQGRVQFNNLRVAYIRGGKGLGESLPLGGGVHIAAPGQPISGSGTVNRATMLSGSGRYVVQLSSTVTYPDDPLEDINNLDQLEQDKINNPSKYNMLVSKYL